MSLLLNLGILVGVILSPVVVAYIIYRLDQRARRKAWVTRFDAAMKSMDQRKKEGEQDNA